MKKVLLIILLAYTILFVSSCSNKKRTINKKEDSDDLLITIYSDNGKSDSKFLIKSFGHSFLALKNLTGSEMYIRDYKIEKDDEITFGAWGIDDHFGIWYDLEAQYQHKAKRYDGVVSVSAYISSDKLGLINEFITNNDTWTFKHNCTYLAITIWNMCVDSNEKFSKRTFNSPSRLHKLIKRFDSYETNREMIMHEYAFTFKDGVKYSYYLEEKSYG